MADIVDGLVELTPQEIMEYSEEYKVISHQNQNVATSATASTTSTVLSVLAGIVQRLERIEKKLDFLVVGEQL